MTRQFRRNVRLISLIGFVILVGIFINWVLPEEYLVYYALILNKTCLAHQSQGLRQISKYYLVFQYL